MASVDEEFPDVNPSQFGGAPSAVAPQPGVVKSEEFPDVEIPRFDPRYSKRPESSQNPDWWERMKANLGNLQLKLPGAHSGPNALAAAKGAPYGIPIINKTLGEKPEDVQREERDYPGTMEGLQTAAGIGTTAPFFELGAAYTPAIKGYGLAKQALRAGLDTAVPGTIGTGINILDKAAGKGGLNADDFYTAAKEGYGASAVGTAAGRMLGPGYNYYLRGNKSFPNSVNDQLAESQSIATKAWDAHAAGKMSYADAATVQATANREQAAIRALKDEQAQGTTLEQLRDISPPFGQRTQNASKAVLEDLIKSKGGADSMHNKLIQGLLAGEFGVMTHTSPLVTGALAGLGYGAQKVPQFLARRAQGIAPREIMKNPATQALLQQMGRKDTIKPDVLAPGLSQE